MYVEDLIAPGIVNTMPAATIDAYADHGETRPDTVTGQYAEAQQLLDDLTAAGVDLDDVVKVLEDEGVEKFATSWNELLDSVKEQLSAAGAAPGFQDATTMPAESEPADTEAAR
jgi:transaldolase